MFEKLNREFETEKKNLLDRITLDLVKNLDIKVPDNPNEAEKIIIMDEVSRLGFKIRHQYNTDGYDEIQLVKIQTNEVLIKFTLKVKVEKFKISIVTV
jgi:hypothetical protein